MLITYVLQHMDESDEVWICFWLRVYARYWPKWCSLKIKLAINGLVFKTFHFYVIQDYVQFSEFCDYF